MQNRAKVEHRLGGWFYITNIIISSCVIWLSLIVYPYRNEKFTIVFVVTGAIYLLWQIIYLYLSLMLGEWMHGTRHIYRVYGIVFIALIIFVVAFPYSDVLGYLGSMILKKSAAFELGWGFDIGARLVLISRKAWELLLPCALAIFMWHAIYPRRKTTD